MALAVLSNSWQSGQLNVSHYFTNISKWTKLYFAQKRDFYFPILGNLQSLTFVGTFGKRVEN